MKNPYSSVNELKVGKITQSQKALFNGLIELWNVKPMYKISVKELIQISNVARSTFYVYYKNIDELAEDVENYHIFNLVQLNKKFLNKELKPEIDVMYYQETIDYIQKNKNTFYAFLIANVNNRFTEKWKDAIKYKLLEREYSWSNTSNCQLILEMVSSQVIAAHTFGLTNPYEVNIKNLDKIVSQTLKALDF